MNVELPGFMVRRSSYSNFFLKKYNSFPAYIMYDRLDMGAYTFVCMTCVLLEVVLIIIKITMTKKEINGKHTKKRRG